MSKKILLKTLLTTSTVGLLGGGIATSLVGCSSSQNNSGTKVLTIGASNTIGTVGTVLPIVVTYSGFNFDVTGHSFALNGSDASYFSLGAENGSGTLNVTLNTSATEARAYNLQIKDRTDNTVVPSNIIKMTLTNPAQKALQINVSTPTITANGIELYIEGTYEAINIDSPHIELVGSIAELLSDFDVIYENKTFTATLSSNALIGDYDLQLVAMVGDDDDIYSNIITFTVGPIAASDGSNWLGRKSGTVQIGVNNANMTATITENYEYVADGLVIPEYVFENGKFYKVTNIGDSAFRDCWGLTGSLTIPSSVINIGWNAFSGCSGLTGSLTIPSSVISIGKSAFESCSGLDGSLTIPNSVWFIGNGAFFSCSGLDGSLTIGDSVISIGQFAFGNCSGLTGSLTIGSGVESIGNGAFVGCSGFTGSLTIPNSVRIIGNNAFEGCSGFINIILDGFDSAPNLWGTNIFSSWSDIGTVSVDGDWPIADALTYLKDKDLPDGWIAQALTIAVSSSTFDNDGNETITGTFTTEGIDDPDIQLTGDDKEIFSNFSLEGNTFSVTISNTITAGDYNLQLIARGVKSNAIPCTVYGNDTGTNWSGRTDGSVEMDLNDDDLIATITSNDRYVAENLIIPEYVFKNGEFYEVTSIGEGAFNECSGLTGSLTIGSGVESIGNWAFGNCTGLTGSLTIPSSVRIIGNNAFAGCSGFNGNLTIGSSVISIGDWAFGECWRLTGSLTIGDSVASIGWAAFYHCGGLKSLTIPNSVASIGDSAFDGCGISTINLRGFTEVPDWGSPNDIFYGWVDHGTVVSDGTYTSAMALLGYLKTLGLPDGWTAA